MTTKSQKFDWLILLCTGILIVIGILMIFSTSSVVGAANYSDSYYFIKKHAVYLILGTIALLIGMGINHEFYKKVLGIGLVGSLLLMLGTFIPGLGVKVGGATRWINIGIQIQPVEILKFFIIVFVANYLDTKRAKLHLFGQGIFPLLVCLCIPVLLLAKQPDLGNILVIMGVSFALIFLSRVPLAQFFGIISSGVALIVINILLHPYQLSRIKTFLFPWKDPLGKSYHIIQSFIAIGSGGAVRIRFGSRETEISLLTPSIF